jgi:hypothetical protein
MLTVVFRMENNALTASIKDNIVKLVKRWMFPSLTEFLENRMSPGRQRSGVSHKSLFYLVFVVFPGAVFSQTTIPAVPAWRGALGGVLLCPPSCQDGVVIAVCDGGFVRAFSYGGRDLWTYRVRGRLAPFVTRGPDGISWVGREEEGGPKSLIALNRVGRKVSEIRFEKPFTAPPEAGLDGRIFVPFGDTVVTCTFSGQKLGESKAGGIVYNGFAPIRPPIYPDITLTMTRAESREPGEEWILDIMGAAVLPAYNGDDLVIVGGQNWLLAAYRVKDPAPPSAPKPPETYGLAKWASPPEWVTREGIAAALDRGNVGDNERVFASFLMETSRVTPTLKLPAATIAERVEALFLLGRLGSPEYVLFLVDVLNRESNPRIKAAAVRAIGAIGIDRDGKAMNAFVKAALPVFPTSDTMVLNAIVEAAGVLSVINGPPIYDRGIAVLAALSAQRTFPDIQKQTAFWLKRVLEPFAMNSE